MNPTPYDWQYLPLLMQVLAAILLGVSMVTASWFVGRHRNTKDVEMVFMMPWAVIYRQLPHITGSRLFGFWEMLVYLGFVAVGLYYIARKGILNWSRDRADL
jgi:NADH-quinone oxidoreductase subunit A